MLAKHSFKMFKILLAIRQIKKTHKTQTHKHTHTYTTEQNRTCWVKTRLTQINYSSSSSQPKIRYVKSKISRSPFSHLYLYPRTNTNKWSFERFLLFERFFSTWAQLHHFWHFRTSWILKPNYERLFPGNKQKYPGKKRK